MDVVTIGETMVLFTPNSRGYMRHAHQFSMKFGGAETNVAVGLSRLGHQAGWISKVGNDEFGKAMVAFVKGENVDVSQVKVDQKHPTGVYFKELRRAGDVRVYYYRKDSAASRLTPEDLNEEYIAQAKFFHITGITPALSDSCANTILAAIKIAKKHGVRVVFDPNLRRKLWSEEKARSVLLHLASLADIVLPGIEEGKFMFDETDPKKIADCFLKNGSANVVVKLGADGAAYFTKDTAGVISGYPVEQVVDPVGAGDGFAAGLLSGLLNGLSFPEAVKRGNAVGALVTMVDGDVEGLPEEDEIEALMNSKNEDVQR
ncbi:sugar kinase [Mesobacillus foraminis]|uniref:2-dehydro-3-deoxygluconokinase n=1 Tax=Mesobacillus foraminis TaxID=279826 RepID=A0A4R2AWM9_9BACI|nr:sugar kinase [Mesobacillus foraminis]TCN18417.1 2-dehydro-3-deoxygluconokinase [Mesobacillus foraminis]